jgi:DNA-binding response OmpR family regulator
VRRSRPWGCTDVDAHLHPPIRTLRTILVVDDEDHVIAVMRRILERHGFRVLSADSANAAQAIIESEKQIALIVSDVHLPGLAGPELLSHLRAGGVDAPVIFMSGDLDITTVDRSLDVRGAFFLPKPFTAAELLSAVNAVLR